jgi:5-methyltetrahydrofolate--homocysteine methyltransferase
LDRKATSGCTQSWPSKFGSIEITKLFILRLKVSENLTTTISSANQTVEISRDKPTVIIGERINPTGRKKVLAALQDGNFDMVRYDATTQVAAGATVLDVNAGVPGADEPALLQQVLRTVMEVADVPLCIDTANPKALEAALSLYEGKALVNSVNGEEKSLEAILPLVKEHGAAVIGLCMDDDGIPATPEARLAVAAKIIERAGKLGIGPEDIVIDPLALTMGADSNAGRVSLKTIELVVQEFGVNITMGASNVSFGMPDRKYINSAFMAMAIYAGMTCPITNPLVTEIVTAVLAADLALGRDDYGMRWIQAYRQRQKAAEAK